MRVTDVGGGAYHRGMTERTLKATLSPSRISDFTGCPLKFRYRNIDRLPERPGVEAFRGTVVHKVLEDLFDQPREARTAEFALGDVQRAFELMVTEQPDARFAIDAALAWPADGAPASPEAIAAFLAALPVFLERYFVVEDPTVFDPTHRERYVRSQVDDDLWLHGFVDRIDVAPTGEVRIVDYKTGRMPGVPYQDKALFQLMCYAWMWEQEHDTPVRRLLMLYLGSGERLVRDPRRQDIESARETVRTVWTAMKRANDTATWQAKPSKLCDWCSFQTRCPAKSSHVPAFEPVPIEFPR